MLDRRPPEYRTDSKGEEDDDNDNVLLRVPDLHHDSERAILPTMLRALPTLGYSGSAKSMGSIPSRKMMTTNKRCTVFFQSWVYMRDTKNINGGEFSNYVGQPRRPLDTREYSTVRAYFDRDVIQRTNGHVLTSDKPQKR